MCCKHKLLPSSYAITDEPERIEEFPSGSGGSADVFCGWHRGSKVAIKQIRHSPNLAGVERARLPTHLSLSKCGCADEGEIEILPRGSALEAVQTPKPVAVARGNQNLARLDDGFQMDGTRDNHGLCYCVS